MKNPAPFVSVLLASGFVPHIWETNETEFVKNVQGCVTVYVDVSKGIISATRTATNERLLTSYFSSNPEEFFIALGKSISYAY